MERRFTKKFIAKEMTKFIAGTIFNEQDNTKLEVVMPRNTVNGLYRHSLKNKVIPEVVTIAATKGKRRKANAITFWDIENTPNIRTFYYPDNVPDFLDKTWPEIYKVKNRAQRRYDLGTASFVTLTTIIHEKIHQEQFAIVIPVIKTLESKVTDDDQKYLTEFTRKCFKLFEDQAQANDALIYNYCLDHFTDIDVKDRLKTWSQMLMWYKENYADKVLEHITVFWCDICIKIHDKDVKDLESILPTDYKLPFVYEKELV